MSDLHFVPASREHAAALDAAARDPDVLRFTRVPDPLPPGFGAEWIARYEAARPDGDKEAFAVLDDAGELVGLALAPKIDREAAEAELGYLTAPHARGRGYATRMLRWLTRWAFGELGIVRAYLIIQTANPGSEEVARRCGYTLEGVMRSTYLKSDIRVDAGLWSRLATDPDPGTA